MPLSPRLCTPFAISTPPLAAISAPSFASDAFSPWRNAARLLAEETLARMPGEPPTLTIHSSSYGLPSNAMPSTERLVTHCWMPLTQLSAAAGFEKSTQGTATGAPHLSPGRCEGQPRLMFVVTSRPASSCSSRSGRAANQAERA